MHGLKKIEIWFKIGCE